MTYPDISEEARSKPAWTIGEVAYANEGKRLTVAVAGDLVKDGLVSEVLTGILATAPEHGIAVRQICAVSEELGWSVEMDHGETADVVVLDPAEQIPRY